MSLQDLLDLHALRLGTLRHHCPEPADGVRRDLADARRALLVVAGACGATVATMTAPACDLAALAELAAREWVSVCVAAGRDLADGPRAWREIVARADDLGVAALARVATALRARGGA